MVQSEDMHYWPFYSPYAPVLLAAFAPLIIVVVLWTVIIKGYALWHAAHNHQKGWFVALLIVNSLGILEVIYLVWFRRPPSPSHHGHSHTPAHHSSAQA